MGSRNRLPLLSMPITSTPYTRPRAQHETTNTYSGVMRAWPIPYARLVSRARILLRCRPCKEEVPTRPLAPSSPPSSAGQSETVKSCGESEQESTPIECSMVHHPTPRKRGFPNAHLHMLTRPLPMLVISSHVPSTHARTHLYLTLPPIDLGGFPAIQHPHQRVRRKQSNRAADDYYSKQPALHARHRPPARHLRTPSSTPLPASSPPIPNSFKLKKKKNPPQFALAGKEEAHRPHGYPLRRLGVETIPNRAVGNFSALLACTYVCMYVRTDVCACKDPF